MHSRRRFLRTVAAGLAFIGASPAAAQLLGMPVPRIPVVQGVLDEATSGIDATVRQAGARVAQLTALLRANPRELERDDQGAPVVRGEIIAIAPSPSALDRARSAGFEIRRREELNDLGLTVVTLVAPEAVPARRALKRLRQIDPDGTYDLNHLYSGAGPAQAVETSAASRPVRIGLIDGGVIETHPALAGVKIEQRGFAPGGISPSLHGTAVASRLVGPTGHLYAADVYGTGPTGGSAVAVARALGWLASEQVAVINISLVGPPNAMVAAAIEAFQKRGHLVVAAVGNDGPAAKPLYPASYPSVVAVTGVDARRRVLLEATRSPSLDFAASGVGLAADAGGRRAAVRGTSFAAPIVAARLAERLSRPDPAVAARAVSDLAMTAEDLGRAGYDKVYGFGLVEGPSGAALAHKSRPGRSR